MTDISTNAIPSPYQRELLIAALQDHAPTPSPLSSSLPSPSRRAATPGRAKAAAHPSPRPRRTPGLAMTEADACGCRPGCDCCN